MTALESYVDSYSDLTQAYGRDFGNTNWEHYVWTGGNKNWQPSQGISDLDNYWNNVMTAAQRQNYENNKGQFPSGKALWGAEHYRDHGQAEGRQRPFYAFDTTVWDKDQWGARHWQLYGNKEDRVVPGAKFAFDENNNVYIARPDLIGDGLKQNYNDLIRVFQNSNGGNYKGLMEGIQASLTSQSFNDLVNYGDLNTLSSYYQQKKVSVWDGLTQGAQPPTGGFDAEYYRLNTTTGAQALQDWNTAQSSVNVGGNHLPDLDIVGRYNRDSYLHWNYTTQGKAAGERGNAAEAASISEGYKEYLTDADYQTYRDQVLGLADRFDNIQDWAAAQDPAVLTEWYNSLPTDQKQEYDNGTLAVPTMDYIPDGLKNKIKMVKGSSTILEGNLSTVLGPKEEQQQRMFGSLTQDSLKQAVSELQKVNQNQQQFDFYKGLPGFNEIFTINESLSNSILGDSGIGGLYGWIGDPSKLQEKVEAGISSATGVPSRNSAIYNWQKWFDEQLTTRYKDGMTITDPNDPSVTYTLDAEFAKDYIDRYLKPRFDNSKSMSEFISYMDVKQNEQNIFQTQSALDSLRDIADLRSKAYLDGIKSSSPLNFDTSFYWNPTGNFTPDDPKIAKYEQQKADVAADWETAKTKGSTEVVPGTDWTWNQWAYHYGLDINNKDQFAKLHYQVKGAANGFDPAHDVITLKDAEDYIQSNILPAVADEKLKIGDITFLNFVTPEEFADKMLEGISPEANKAGWDKLLETLGLSDKEMGITEVKQYIIDSFRTGAAKDIRESIKYLNEKKTTPTQKELGVDYIERPSDAAPTTDPNATSLYKIFQGAGYQGSEDDFYNNFMTDVNRNEMQLLTQAGKGLQTNSVFSDLTSKDPFQSLGAIENLFNDSSSTSTTSSTSSKTTDSYFKLFDDTTGDTSDGSYKTKTGQNILDEFTSLFKGFN